MSPKVLPRPSTETTKRAGGGRRAAGPSPAAAGTGQAKRRVLRRPAVVALVAIGAVVVGGLGWTFLSSSRTAPGVPAAGLTRPVATPSHSDPAPTASVPDVSVGRDPFAASTSGTASSSGTSTPTTSPPTVATTSHPTGSPSASMPTVTVTVTSSAGPTYVGLYAWSGTHASFRVNARTYDVGVGAHFGPGLVFAAIVSGQPSCARLTHAGASLTLCPGQVTTLP